MTRAVLNIVHVSERTLTVTAPIPLLREGGVAAPKEKWSRSTLGADGVVVSSHRLYGCLNQPRFLMAAPYRACACSARRPLRSKDASRYFLRSRPPLLNQGGEFVSLRCEVLKT